MIQILPGVAVVVEDGKANVKYKNGTTPPPEDAIFTAVHAQRESLIRAVTELTNWLVAAERPASAASNIVVPRLKMPKGTRIGNA